MVGTEGEIFVVLGETRYVLVWAGGGGGGWNFRFLQLRNYALLWLLGDSCEMLASKMIGEVARARNMTPGCEGNLIMAVASVMMMVVAVVVMVMMVLVMMWEVVVMMWEVVVMMWVSVRARKTRPASDRVDPSGRQLAWEPSALSCLSCSRTQ